jgi:hypothetical protein
MVAHDNKHLWVSSGIDAAVGAHKFRLECIEAAIGQLGRLRGEWGYAIDQLPADVNGARDALWRAYHAERKRGEALAGTPDGAA